MPRTMPVQKPGKSETVVRTPPEFLAAVRAMLRITQFDIDLAASDDNAVTGCYITKEMDSLALEWDDLFSAWAWLNPPYDHITPWAKKAVESHTCIAMLVPASVGSNWWEEYVHERASILYVKPRLSFLDKDGNPILDAKGKRASYPKDLALILYGVGQGVDYFHWREQSA